MTLTASPPHPPTARHRLRRRLAGAALATGALLAVAAPAQAAVSATQITSITGAPSPYTSYSDATAATTLWNVTGTASGTGNVDLKCFGTGAPPSTLVTDLPVVDGAFATPEGEPVYGVGRDESCDLRAVPAGATPADLSPFAARRVGVGFTSTTSADFSNSHPQAGGYASYSSIGNAGLGAMKLTGGPFLFNANGALQDSVPLGGAQASVLVDGQPAFTPYVANLSSPGASGKPAITSHTTTVDPATGDTTITDVEPLVSCANNAAPDGAGCQAFTPANVSIARTIRQDHDGRLTRLVDVVRSAGGAHAVTLRYVHQQNTSGANGYRFGAAAAYTAPAADQVVVPTAAAVTTVRVKYDNAPGVSLANPVGGLSIAPAPDRFAFVNGSFFVSTHTLDVPAGGSQTVSQTYTLAASDAALDDLVADAEDPAIAPAVSIGAGATAVSTPSLAVTGTATGRRAPALTVNGAAVAVGAGGAWSTTVALRPGANTITATATNSGGLTATATRTVTYTPPATPPSAGPGTGTGTGTGTSTAPGPGAPTAKPTPKPVGKPASVTFGKATSTLLPLSLRCAAGSSCSGRVTLTAKVRKAGSKKLVTVTLAKASYTLKAGAKLSLKVKLTASGRASLKRARTLKVRVAITRGGGSTVVRTVTFKAPKK